MSQGDNFKVDVTGIGDNVLNWSLEILAQDHVSVVGYRIDNTNPNTPKLIFYWAKSDKFHPLLVPISTNKLGDTIQKWLAEQDYGNEPDIDGNSRRGFRIYTDSWGMVDGEWQTSFAVEPEWIMYGK